MLGTDFYVFLLAMILAIVLLFLMVWHVSYEGYGLLDGIHVYKLYLGCHYGVLLLESVPSS